MVRFTTLERAYWRPVVDALAALGFDAIDVPLVWREHERAVGHIDFRDGSRALEAMAQTVRDAGLRWLVRLGPMPTDDAAGLGLPERVLADRACQARTRRQNPVLVPDPPRVVPLPSLASEAFREQACAWTTAAAGAVAELGGLGPDRVVIGIGPHAQLRDDPFDQDYHPDAGSDDGESIDALARVDRETRHAVEFRARLTAAAVAAGLDDDRFIVAVPGAASLSPTAHALAARHALALPSPPPIAGSLAIWRQVRHAVALTHPHGLHLDVWSGGAPYYPPARGSHTVDAARVALAAGARSFTVRMGCAGDRWVGAILSERGQLRPHAPLWRELLAWARELPSGDEICAELIESEARVRAARATSSVRPLPLGLLGLLGLSAGEVAERGTSAAGERSIDEEEAALATAEGALIAAGVPVRRVPASGDTVAFDGASEPAAFIATASSTLAHVAPVVEPAGAALVRALHDGQRTHLLVLSQVPEPAHVTPPGPGWSLHTDDGTPDVSQATMLAPGAALRFSRDEPASPARPPRPASERPARRSSAPPTARKRTRKKSS